ncbi:MAG: hypothetical protein WEB37_00120 [Bacteroidota bacterium]
MNFSAISILCLVVSSLGFAQMRTIEGKGEEYHHAMYLNFKHAAEQAQALYTQVSLPHALVMEIAREHADEILLNLDRAKIQHAMVHKTFGVDETRMIMENHDNLLQAHIAATETCRLLKAELDKETADRESIKKFARQLYVQTSKAASEHLDGMKKLGLQEMKVPS